jgi:hypothetical protein
LCGEKAAGNIMPAGWGFAWNRPVDELRHAMALMMKAA